MPLRLEIKKLLSSRSERVKSCDLHPTEPWVLSALYSGQLFIWNYNTQTVVRSIDVGDQPIRCAKFITRKQWIICGADDMMLRVFNYNTMEKIATFEGHMDYIRCIDVHPTQPYVLSSGDDMVIKLWNWEAGWNCTQTFEGHAHYVMQVKWNPKDSNTFASASLDKSLKMWSIGNPLPNFSLEGHDRGVNTLDFYPGNDKPYIISGADDRSLKIFDYQTKSCVQTLEGHTGNVSAVCFHPKLPIILSGSEDGTVRMWHSTTYRLETTLNYGLERCWALAVTPESNKVSIGYDEGTIVIGLGQEKPVVSMDNSGKILMANNNDIVSCAVRNVSSSGVADGERIDVQTKDLGSCEIFPQKVTHNSNGRFVAVCGDGEYIIYTSQALRNKSFGSALDFAWSSDGTGDYSVRESSSRIRIFKNFKETKVFKPPFSAEGLVGGNLIGIVGSEFIVFYDWTDCRLVMRIDVAPKDVFWSENGEQVVLACEDSYYVLQCDQEAIQEAFNSGTASAEDGVDGAFTLVHEISETVESGQWVGGCFLYSNTAGRLNYYIGGEVMTLTHLDRQMFLLGFVSKENRVFLVDKNRAIVSFVLLEAVLNYQTAVVRKDFDLANQLLATIPPEKYNDISRFLESQGHKEFALQVATDPDQKFDLALQLEKLDIALQIMQKDIAPNAGPDDTEIQSRWKQLGDLSLSSGNLGLAEECAKNASDLSGLLLMYTSSGNATGIATLLQLAEASKRANVAFICALLLGDKEKCIELLSAAGRLAEAAFFARTFSPSRMEECVDSWKKDLAQVNPRAAQALATPSEYPDLFPGLDSALAVEQVESSARAGKSWPSEAFPQVAGYNNVVLMDLLNEQGEDAIRSFFGGMVPSGVAAGRSASASSSSAAQAEALRRQGEAEARQKQQEAEMLLQQQEAEVLRQQQEAETIRKQQEAEALRKQEEAEALRKQQEAEALRQQQEAEALRQQQEAEALRQQREAEALRKQQETEAIRKQEEAEELRKQQEALQRQQEAEAMQRQQEQLRLQQQQEAERLHQQQQEAERIKREQQAAELQRQQAASSDDQVDFNDEVDVDQMLEGEDELDDEPFNDEMLEGELDDGDNW